MKKYIDGRFQNVIDDLGVPPLENDSGYPFQDVQTLQPYETEALRQGRTLPLYRYPRIYAAFLKIRNNVGLDFPLVKETKLYVYPGDIMQCFAATSNDWSVPTPEPVNRNFVLISEELEKGATEIMLDATLWRVLVIKAYQIYHKKFPTGSEINTYLSTKKGIVLYTCCPKCGLKLMDDYDTCPRCRTPIKSVWACYPAELQKVGSVK